MTNLLLANISWNAHDWRMLTINPHANFSYVVDKPGHESLNFDFDKPSIDTLTHARGFGQWSVFPTQFEDDGLIIFYSTNTDTRRGKIVGLYGKARVLREKERYNIQGFEGNQYTPNIIFEKEYSLLFPIKLDVKTIKDFPGERLVGRNGFDYISQERAEEILLMELRSLVKAQNLGEEFQKLLKVFTLYTGKAFSYSPISDDAKEEEEFLIENKEKTKEELRTMLRNTPQLEHEFYFQGTKVYKRDNRTIALIKLFRDSKCQLCQQYILKKDGSRYIEAAHIDAKHRRGPETPDNIILLCPNHHKEFDLGNRVKISRTKERYVFELNGNRHDVDLSI